MIVAAFLRGDVTWLALHCWLKSLGPRGVQSWVVGPCGYWLSCSGRSVLVRAGRDAETNAGFRV